MSNRHHRAAQSEAIHTTTLREEISKRPFRRKVDPLNNALDFRTALLGGFGFTSGYIASQTGLSPGQITYRLRKSGVKISDFRNGRGVIAHQLFKHHRRECEPLLRKQIAAALRAHAAAHHG
jgi:hypothetical protein